MKSILKCENSGTVSHSEVQGRETGSKYQSRTYQNLLYLGHSPVPEIFKAKQQSLCVNHISQRNSSNARVELRDAVALPSQKPCEEPTKQHLLLSVVGLHKTWAIMIWKPRSLAANIIPVPLLMSWFKLDLQEQPLSWKQAIRIIEGRSPDFWKSYNWVTQCHHRNEYQFSHYTYPARTRVTRNLCAVFKEGTHTA